MEPYRVFKKCLEFAASRFHVKFSEFLRCRGIRDFLLDEAERASTPKELAANALVKLCDGDAGQMDIVVCAAVVQFLDRELGIPREDQDQMRRIVDLLHMTKEPANREQYLKWANDWYP